MEKWLRLRIYIIGLLFSLIHTFTHAQDGLGFYIGYDMGWYTYGMREIQCYLEHFNFSMQYDQHSKLYKPFRYNNNYKGYSLGLGGISEIKENIHMYFDATFNHHRNIYEAEAYTFDINTLTYRDLTCQYRERINYINGSIGVMGFKIIYGGLGLDLGKLGLHYREFPTGEKPPRFKRKWRGDLLLSPGGYFTSMTLFVGLFPRIRSVGLNAKLYYQFQLFPSGAMSGSDTEHYINTSCWGIKIFFAFGNLTDLR